MTVTEKFKSSVFPALFIIGLGFLEIKFPHAMNGFDDNYTGRGIAGLTLLLFELFLALTWGKIEGIILIFLGFLLLLFCCLPQEQQSKKTPEILEAKGDENESATSLSSLAFQASKTYLKQQAKNQQS